jgi:hypothetical protein
MDPRNDIREFLVSRRARITPEQAGLPAYGTNRRVKGLRREEVALLAGISAEYYVRLERGNVRGVSEESATSPGGPRWSSPNGTVFRTRTGKRFFEPP